MKVEFAMHFEEYQGCIAILIGQRPGTTLRPGLARGRRLIQGTGIIPSRGSLICRSVL